MKVLTFFICGCRHIKNVHKIMIKHNMDTHTIEYELARPTLDNAIHRDTMLNKHTDDSQLAILELMYVGSSALGKNICLHTDSFMLVV